MFNFAGTKRGSFKPMKVLGGASPGDYDSYKTLYCGKQSKFKSILTVIGTDPSDPTRILVRKIVQVNEGTYGYEEVTIERGDNGKL